MSQRDNETLSAESAPPTSRGWRMKAYAIGGLLFAILLVAIIDAGHRSKEDAVDSWAQTPAPWNPQNEGASFMRASTLVHPSSPQAYLFWGPCLQEHNRLTGTMKRSVENGTDPVSIHTASARILRRQGRHQEAAWHFAQLIRLDPSDAVHRFSLGLSLLEIRQIDMGVQALREAIALEPDLAEAHYQLALALLKSSQVDDAVEPLTITTRLRPEFGSGWFNLGVALAKTGRFEEGIAALERALEIDPVNEQARAYLSKLSGETKAAGK